MKSTRFNSPVMSVKEFVSFLPTCCNPKYPRTVSVPCGLYNEFVTFFSVGFAPLHSYLPISGVRNTSSGYITCDYYRLSHYLFCARLCSRWSLSRLRACSDCFDAITYFVNRSDCRGMSFVDLMAANRVHKFFERVSSIKPFNWSDPDCWKNGHHVRSSESILKEIFSNLNL